MSWLQQAPGQPWLAGAWHCTCELATPAAVSTLGVAVLLVHLLHIRLHMLLVAH